MGMLIPLQVWKRRWKFCWAAVMWQRLKRCTNGSAARNRTCGDWSKRPHRMKNERLCWAAATSTAGSASTVTMASPATGRLAGWLRRRAKNKGDEKGKIFSIRLNRDYEKIKILRIKNK